MSYRARTNGNSTTSGCARCRMIQSPKSSSLRARKPRGSVTTPSAISPRAVAVTIDNSSHNRRCSGECSLSSTSLMRSRTWSVSSTTSSPGTCAPPNADAAARAAACTASIDTSGGSGEVVSARPSSVAKVTDSEKSSSSCITRRRKSTTVSSRPVASGSPGRPSACGRRARPNQPVAAPLVRKAEVVGRDQRLIPVANRSIGIGCRSVEFAVALSKQCEGVLVGAEPDVKAVLLDPAVVPATGGTLAAEPRAALVDGDRFETVSPTGLAEPPCGRQTRHPPAEYGDAGFGAAHPSSARACASSGQAVVSGNRPVTSASASRAGSPNASK